MMAWPEKMFFSGKGVQKMRILFSHFWVLFDVDFAMKAKKKGVRIPAWRYGPCKNSVQEGWKLCFAVFSVFFSRHRGAATPTTDHVLVPNQPQICFLGVRDNMAPPTTQKCRVACPLGNGKGPHPLGRGFAACPRGPPPVALSTS